MMQKAAGVDPNLTSSESDEFDNAEEVEEPASSRK